MKILYQRFFYASQILNFQILNLKYKKLDKIQK